MICIPLGRFNIATAVMTLSSFRAAPRVGHLDQCKHVYGYLLQFKEATIRIQADEPDWWSIPNENYDWMHSVCGNAEEPLPHDAPMPLGKYIQITHFIDANCFHYVRTTNWIVSQFVPSIWVNDHLFSSVWWGKDARGKLQLGILTEMMHREGCGSFDSLSTIST